MSVAGADDGPNVSEVVVAVAVELGPSVEGYRVDLLGTWYPENVVGSLWVLDVRKKCISITQKRDSGTKTRTWSLSIGSIDVAGADDGSNVLLSLSGGGTGC